MHFLVAGGCPFLSDPPGHSGVHDIQAATARDAGVSPWPRLSLVPIPIPNKQKRRFRPVYIPEGVQGH